MPVRFILFAPLMVFVAITILLWSALEREPGKLPSALIGKAFPEFSLTKLSSRNQYLSFSDLSGAMVLVNVWATWCYACKLEHPYLQKLASSGVKIIGINYKDNRKAAIAWLEKLGDPYLVTIFDKDGSLGLDLGVYGAPETYLIDAQGIILHRRVGVLDQKVWEREFSQYYADSGE